MDNKRWITVSDSPHDHEREALAWLRSRLPDREPFHVWANFEFTTHHGHLYEVDALVVSDNGVHLVEIKSHPGRIDGDAGTWQWTTPENKFRQMDNPRILANRKAKALKSLLESSKTFRNARNEVPYVSEAVFLSDPKLRSGLNPNGRWLVFGRDPDSGHDLPPERAALGGIVQHLTSLAPDASGKPRRRLDRTVAAKVVKAMNDIGVRPQSSRREIGDYRVGALLDDETDTLAGVAYQDFLATHRSLDLTRRLRIYPLERNATAEQRETAARAARREFELLRPLDHRGVVRPVDYTEHERGPVLFFDHDPAEVSLRAFMADPDARTLTVDQRLGMVRQIAEALHYANGRGIYHRSLSPSAVLVTPAAEPGGIPRVRLASWHTGAREANGTNASTGNNSGSLMAGTAHGHVEALAASDAELYRAPEFLLPAARPAGLDVFSLGALTLLILTGTAPAASVRQLRKQLESSAALDPTAVADGIDPGLVDLVINATWVDPAERFASVEAFLTALDVAEANWAAADEPEETDPTEARRDDVLAGGRFRVLQRLGQGSTAVALLVTDAAELGALRVVKVAERPEHNDRIVDEAAALDGLHHACIVRLADGPLDLSGHAAIVVTYAGPKVDPAKPDTRGDRQARTLATRLADGPVGAELAQRWGEDLLDALRYLEGMGRAHRDIKPDNLGVAPRGENNELHLVLFDFSLASAPLDRIEAGTPGYVDPFLERRGRWDPAADRYSAAVTLFQMTTGTRPRYGDGTADPALVPAPPAVEPSMFDPAAAVGLTAFFTKALQPEASARYGTADEMYWAWHEAFRASAAPATRSHHPDADDDFVIPPGTTTDTPLAGLPLSKRAVSALERAEVVTVGDLLAFNLMAMRTMPGVGAKTRGEVREAVDLLRALFEPDDVAADTSDDHDAAPVTTATAGTAQVSVTAADTEVDRSDRLVRAEIEVVVDDLSSLVAAAAATLPSPGRGQAGANRYHLARALAGLVPGVDPWASQAELAQWLGLTPARVSQLVARLRTHWAELEPLTELRHQLRGELDLLQVASAGQLAARLAATTADGTEPGAAEAAAGLVRLAVLTEEAEPEPGWVVRRRHGAAVLARRASGPGGDDTAQALAEHAVAVAAAASALVARHDVVPRIELLDHLRRVPAPAGVPPLGDAHLADLAADLVADAAVNARLELYRRGLDPVAALRAVRRAVAAAKLITPAELAARVAARFPDAAPLPERPELDRLLAEAGIDLVWQPAAGAWRNPQLDEPPTSAVTASVSRATTGTPIPAAEIDNAAEFERRLAGARNHGGVLVLVAELRKLAIAQAELEPLVSATVDLDAAFVAAMRAVTAGGKPSWSTITAADAAGPSGPAWGRLNQVVDRVADQIADHVAATGGTVLVTNPGLLARYDRLDLVARWRDRLHAKQGAFTALWLLLPGSGGADVPLLDGRPVPVISRNEWSHIPADWLRSRRRVPEPLP